LKYASSVTFNGLSETSVDESAGAMSVVAPASATTYKIEVTTLSSIVNTSRKFTMT
jgi:hypothetical protein